MLDSLPEQTAGARQRLLPRVRWLRPPKTRSQTLAALPAVYLTPCARGGLTPMGIRKKQKKIEMLQKALKPEAEKMGSGFINHPDAQSYIIKFGAKLLKEATTKGKKSSKNK
ncbi:hypothetical protein [Desulfovibrio sp.]|uniref:hypothetical protein n=1 Tax=Desulfovibrio sp. TaxID=885 RepID=UPI0025BAA97B|nr:hypothetical protein [Desulfovibrio sp.]